MVTEAVFNSGLRRYPTEGETWKADWICYYFINDSVPPSFVVDVSEYYERKRAALDCHASQFQRTAPDAAETRLNTPLFRQLVESRDAQFGALAGVRWAAGVVRQPSFVRPVEGRTMKVGIVCYASVGGSGVIASDWGRRWRRAGTACTS